MSYIIYVCPKELPARIPEILRGAGHVVSTVENSGDRSHIVKNPFTYQVTRGFQAVTISGAEEGDGTSAFAVTMVWSLNPLRMFGSGRLHRSVLDQLIAAGAKEYTPGNESRLTSPPQDNALDRR